MGNKSILVVEDDQMNQQLVRVLLAAEGYDLRSAMNAGEALKVLTTFKPDLILMDIQMPGMNGMEATARIREKEKITGGHQPIVALTAHAMKGDQELCLAAGMDGYLAKPIRAQELDQILDQLAGRGAAIVK